MKKFRTLIFLAFCGIVVLILCLLGHWQWQRYQWKTQQTSLPLIESLPEMPQPETLAYRKAGLALEMIPEAKPIILKSKYHAGKPGSHIIMPFRPLSATKSFIIPVLLGWVPEGGSIHAPPVNRVSGTFLPYSRKPAWYMPQNDPDKNIWYWAYAPQVAAEFEKRHNTPVLQAVLVSAERPMPPGAELVAAEFLPPQEHLNYAITWYALAFIIGVLTLYVYKKSRDE